MSIVPANAKDTKIYTEQLENGLTVEYIIEDLSSSRATYQKVGRKTANIRNDTSILWSVTVTGTFTYDGNHSVCTKAEVSTTCPASAWRIASSSATKSGASATAKATAQRYNNGVVVQTMTEAVSLVCGSDGTLY